MLITANAIDVVCCFYQIGHDKLPWESARVLKKFQCLIIVQFLRVAMVLTLELDIPEKSFVGIAVSLK